MLDHVTLDVRDVEASREFYERALEPLGYRLAVQDEGLAAFGTPDAAIPDFWIRSGEPSGPVHIALSGDRSAVDGFHAAAVAAGGQDNGAPGVRAHYHENYYAAYVRDPDGNNIEVVSHTPA